MKNLTRTVALSKCPDYHRGNLEKSIRSVLDNLGGLGQHVSNGDRVLIKPNLKSLLCQLYNELSDLPKIISIELKSVVNFP